MTFLKSRINLNDKRLAHLKATTSKGNQRKWKDGDTWYKKDELGYEGIAEYLSYLVLHCSTIPESKYVKYEPCELIIGDKVYNGCKSIDFIQGRDEITLGRLLERNNIHIEKELEGLSCEDGLVKLSNIVSSLTGLDIEDDLRFMFAFDSFILNEDRHINNITFIINEEGNIQLAPIFDNGLSLLSDLNEFPKGIRVKELMNRVKPRLLCGDFNKHLQLYKGPPFIYKDRLIRYLNIYDESLGRAGTVLRIQINSGLFDKLFIKEPRLDNTKDGTIGDVRRMMITESIDGI